MRFAVGGLDRSDLDARGIRGEQEQARLRHPRWWPESGWCRRAGRRAPALWRRRVASPRRRGARWWPGRSGRTGRARPGPRSGCAHRRRRPAGSVAAVRDCRAGQSDRRPAPASRRPAPEPRSSRPRPAAPRVPRSRRRYRPPTPATRCPAGRRPRVPSTARRRTGCRRLRVRSGVPVRARRSNRSRASLAIVSCSSVNVKSISGLTSCAGRNWCSTKSLSKDWK